MKKTILALVVTVLVIAGIVGYVWVFRGLNTNVENTPRLEGCSGSGLALIKYNGNIVKVRYEMHPDFKWKHGEKRWYCLVQVYLLQPINGVGGFGVPKEEFESKYLVRYLSNTTEETPATLLETLNGEWVSAGGEELTKWWNNLPEVKAGEMWDYIDKLWDRMENSNKYYDYTFPSSQWSVPPKPLPNQTVKVYSIRLWYGARLDILAYQNPTDPSRLEIVMYGTIENISNWYDGIVRLSVFSGLIPTWIEKDGDMNNELLSQYALFTFNTPVEIGFGNSLANSLLYLTNRNTSTIKEHTVMAVWKITPPSEGGYIVTGNATLTPEVSWILEQPDFTGIYPASADELFWLLIGAPVFQVSANMLLPESVNYLDYAEWVKNVIHEILPQYPYGYDYETSVKASVSPLVIRMNQKGICMSYAYASAMIASLSAGLPVGYLVGTYEGSSIEGLHAISVIIIPSSTNKMGDFPIGYDIDKDGKNDTFIVLYDTAHQNREELEYFIKYEAESIVTPPYKFAVGLPKADFITLAGLEKYINMLGEPFKTVFTMTNITNEILYKVDSNIENVPGVEYFVNPNATAVDNPALYIWKIRMGTVWGARIEIPENVTPNWFFQEYILPKYDTSSHSWYIIDRSWQGKGGDRYFTPSIRFIQELFKVALEEVWGYPQNYSPLPPPIKPAKIPSPVPLEQLYPQLSTNTIS